jgi:hypothetical protein
VVGWLPDQAFRMHLVGSEQDLLAGLQAAWCPMIVHHLGAEEREGRVIVHCVLPHEELLAKRL